MELESAYDNNTIIILVGSAISKRGFRGRPNGIKYIWKGYEVDVLAAGEIGIVQEAELPVTSIKLNKTDAEGIDNLSVIETWDDSTNPVKAIVTLRHGVNQKRWKTFNVVGASGIDADEITLFVALTGSGEEIEVNAEVFIDVAISGNIGAAAPPPGYVMKYRTSRTGLDDGEIASEGNNMSVIRISTTSHDGLAVDNIDTMNSLVGTPKGMISIRSALSAAKYFTGKVISLEATGAIFEPYDMTITALSTGVSFEDNDTVYVEFLAAGLDGQNGTGPFLAQKGITTNRTMADPGPVNFRINNNTPADVTEIAIGEYNPTLHAFFAALISGDIIQFNYPAGLSGFANYEITGVNDVNSNYLVLTVVFISGTGDFGSTAVDNVSINVSRIGR